MERCSLLENQIVAAYFPISPDDVFWGISGNGAKFNVLKIPNPWRPSLGSDISFQDGYYKPGMSGAMQNVI